MMSSPGYTVFCSGGHVVKDVLHGYIDESILLACPYCGSKKFHSEIEWRDLDYGEPLIPVNHIDEVWVKVDNDYFKGELKVKVFDVSRVKEWKKTHL